MRRMLSLVMAKSPKQQWAKSYLCSNKLAISSKMRIFSSYFMRLKITTWHNMITSLILEVVLGNLCFMLAFKLVSLVADPRLQSCRNRSCACQSRILSRFLLWTWTVLQSITAKKARRTSNRIHKGVSFIIIRRNNLTESSSHIRSSFLLKEDCSPWSSASFLGPWWALNKSPTRY